MTSVLTRESVVNIVKRIVDPKDKVLRIRTFVPKINPAIKPSDFRSFLVDCGIGPDRTYYPELFIFYYKLDTTEKLDIGQYIALASLCTNKDIAVLDLLKWHTCHITKSTWENIRLILKGSLYGQNATQIQFMNIIKSIISEDLSHAMMIEILLTTMNERHRYKMFNALRSRLTQVNEAIYINYLAIFADSEITSLMEKTLFRKMTANQWEAEVALPEPESPLIAVLKEEPKEIKVIDEIKEKKDIIIYKIDLEGLKAFEVSVDWATKIEDSIEVTNYQLSRKIEVNRSGKWKLKAIWSTEKSDWVDV